MITVVLLMVAFFGIIAAIVFGTRFFFDRKNPEQIISANKSNPEANTLFMKKFPEADLREYQSIFIRVGLIFSLAVVIAAFSYTKYDKKIMDLGQSALEDELEVEAPQTQREITPPPPPPPPEIQVVENEEIIEEEDNIVMEEVDEKTVIAPPPPAPAEEEKIKEDEIFQIVEEMPEFPGGQEGLLKYLSQIPYPPIARENDIEGTVYIRFVIDKNGQVTNVEVARGADKILNEAALNHVKKMPAWKPGKQRGKPVRVQYVVPIRFRLS